MNECADRCRTLHSIRKPNVEREHGALTGTTNEHQHEGRGNDETSGGNGLGHIGGDEGLGALPHHNVGAHEREAERLDVEAEDEDTDEEEHVGEAGDDEGLLRGGHGGVGGIIESDEQIRAHAHQLPEKVHLEDVGGQHKSEHRHREEAQESVVALEAFLAVHIAERIDVDHERHR